MFQIVFVFLCVASGVCVLSHKLTEENRKDDERQQCQVVKVMKPEPHPKRVK